MKMFFLTRKEARQVANAAKGVKLKDNGLEAVSGKRWSIVSTNHENSSQGRTGLIMGNKQVLQQSNGRKCLVISKKSRLV